MSVSLFPAGEPLRVSVHSGVYPETKTGALIGFSDDDQSKLYGIVVTEHGSVIELGTDEFTVDWRYDPERDRWYDTNDPRSEESDQDG